MRRGFIAPGALHAQAQGHQVELYLRLLTPRFAPSQRAWVLSGFRVPVEPAVPASPGRDSDDRQTFRTQLNQRCRCAVP